MRKARCGQIYHLILTKVSQEDLDGHIMAYLSMPGAERENLTERSLCTLSHLDPSGRLKIERI